MATFDLKRRDTAEALLVTLLNPNGTVRDLTGATAVHLHVRIENTWPHAVFSRPMSIETPVTAGKVKYQWADTDWNTLRSGNHKMEYEVIAGTSRQTFPTKDSDTLSIGEDIGQGT